VRPSIEQVDADDAVERRDEDRAPTANATPPARDIGDPAGKGRAETERAYQPQYGYRPVEGKGLQPHDLRPRGAGDDAVPVPITFASMVKRLNDRKDNALRDLYKVAVDSEAAGMPFSFGIVELRPGRKKCRGGDTLTTTVHRFFSGGLQDDSECADGAAALGGIMLATIKSRQYSLDLEKARVDVMAAVSMYFSRSEVEPSRRRLTDFRIACPADS
jgi:hypothetical protein